MGESSFELSNIREFLKLHREIELIDKTISHCKKYRRDSTKQLDRKQQLQNALALQQQELLDLPAESSSVGKRYVNLKKQLQIIHDRLIPNEYGHPIDRNQGLMRENHIYTNILQDLFEVLSNEFMGVSLPRYYYSASSDFDPSPLKKLFLEILTELHAGIAPSTFVELYELIIRFEIRVIAIAKDEYDTNRDQSHIIH